MKTVINGQAPIEFSIGNRCEDNCPTQRVEPDFKAFIDVIWANTSNKKGMTYICAPFGVGRHDKPNEYEGEKSWRLKKLVKPRQFLPLDIDGMTPEVWVWLRAWLRKQAINCCWYTTSNHTVKQPRARIVVALDRVVTRDEGITLGMAFEAHIQTQNPDTQAIDFDQSVYRGEQPFFLPVINDKTKQETEMDTDSYHAVCDQQYLDVDYFLSKMPKVVESDTEKPVIGAWQQKSIAKQTDYVEVFKQALREWAETGAQNGFDSDMTQAKEKALRRAGSIWNWCWMFDEQSRLDVLAELIKTPVNELGDNGRIKWLATVTLAARLAQVGSPSAQKIKGVIFEWSQKHECYEHEYDGSVNEFEKIWAEGECTTSDTNLPIKLLLNLRKQKRCLPKLMMANGSELDVLARPTNVSNLFKVPSDFNYDKWCSGFESLFSAIQTQDDTQQLKLFDEPLEQDKEATQRFKFLEVSTLQSSEPIEWRVKNILPKTGLAAVYGASGSGKTFLVLDLLARISLGLDFFGHKTAQCPIVYVCLEGKHGVSNRIKAWGGSHKAYLPSSFRIMVDQLSLANQDAEQFALAVSLNQLDGGVIVIDTLNQSAPTADENSSKDMGTIIQNAQTIQRMTNSLVILVHHTGKDKSRGLRGHSSLIAALDAAIEVKEGTLCREWALTKAKDAENIAGQFFRLDSVPLGSDDEGQPINSCVVCPNYNVVFHKPPPTGKNQKIVFEALQGLLDNTGSISRTELIDHVKPKLGGDLKRQRARAGEAINGLLDSGHITETEAGDISLKIANTF